MERLAYIVVIYLFSLIFVTFGESDMNILIKRIEKLEHKVQDLQKNLDSYREFCKTLPDDVCGPCMCKDDDKLGEKYYCDCQNIQPKRDCLELKQYGNKISGVYKIHLNVLRIIQVYCDQNTDGGGWTVFQRRIDSSVNFMRDWDSYKLGFGQLQNEFWLGNENLFILSYQGLYPRGNEIRIDMKNSKGISKFSKYKFFEVGNSLSQYTLRVSGYTGTAGDSLSYNSGMKFSTYDNDNDNYDINCALNYDSGWWFNQCFTANLNGLYYYGGKITGKQSTGIHWGSSDFTNHKDLPLIFSEMKIRRNL